MKPWLVSAPLTLILMACGTDQLAVQPPPPPVVGLTLPTSTLTVGDNFSLTARVDFRSAYLYLYEVDPQGQINQLLPNRTE